MPPTGWTITDKEAGNITLDETLVEIHEQKAEVAVVETALTRDQADERVKDDEPGIDVVDGIEQERKIQWESKGTIATGTKFRDLFLDKREDFDAGKIGPQGGEKWKLVGGEIGVRSDDDDTSDGGSGPIRQGQAGGDGCGDVQGEQAFATGVITIKECDARERDALLPEPAGGLRCGVIEVVLVEGKGSGELAHGSAVLCEHGMECTDAFFFGLV